MKQRPYYPNMNAMTLLKGKQNIGTIGSKCSDFIVPYDPPRNDDNLIGRNAVSNAKQSRQDWFENQKFIRDALAGNIKFVI